MLVSVSERSVGGLVGVLLGADAAVAIAWNADWPILISLGAMRIELRASTPSSIRINAADRCLAANVCARAAAFRCRAAIVWPTIRLSPARILVIVVMAGAAGRGYLAGKSIRGRHALSIVRAIGSCAVPSAGAGGEVSTTAADTARHSYCRRSPTSSCVIAAAAAVTTCADHRASATCCTKESAGSDKRLIQLARGCSRKWRASDIRQRCPFSEASK
jgi:hypothetical protein